MALSFRIQSGPTSDSQSPILPLMNQSLSQAGPQRFISNVQPTSNHKTYPENEGGYTSKQNILVSILSPQLQPMRALPPTTQNMPVYMEPSVSSIGPIGSGLRGRANARMERQESWGRPRADSTTSSNGTAQSFADSDSSPSSPTSNSSMPLSPLLKPYFGTSLNSNTHTPPSSLSRTFGQMSPSSQLSTSPRDDMSFLEQALGFLESPALPPWSEHARERPPLPTISHQRSLPTLDQHVEVSHQRNLLSLGHQFRPRAQSLSQQSSSQQGVRFHDSVKIETTYSKGEYDRRPSSPEPLTQSDIVKHLLFRSSLPLSPDMSRIASADGYFNPQSIKPHQTASQYMPLSPTFQIQRELVGIKPHAPDVLSPSTKSSTKSSSKLQNLLSPSLASMTPPSSPFFPSSHRRPAASRARCFHSIKKTSQVDIDEEVVEKLVKAASVCAREAVMGMPLTDIDGLTRCECGEAEVPFYPWW